MRRAGGDKMRVEIVRKRFGAQTVLQDIVFDLADRERVAILGPSGIGKTTLMRIVSGLDTAFEGRITGAGRLSFAFQEPTLLPWRSLRQNLTLATRCDDREADEMLAAVGLEGLGDRFPETLSLGQARRVALARAFLARPETLLLDEPFVSLDADSAARMEDLLGALLERHPARLLIVTHDPDAARRVAEREIVLTGPPGTILHDRRYPKA